MTGTHPLYVPTSPIFPPEKDYDVPMDYTPLTHSGSLQVFIKLVEPAIFLQGFESSGTKQSSLSSQTNSSSSILRGSLIIRVLKPTKLKSIKLNLKGYCRTEWPEGIPPKKHEFVEINDVINHTWPFYQHDHFKYIPISTNTNNNIDNNSNIHVEYLLKNSSAAMYQPLPKNVLQSHSNSTTDGTLATINALHEFTLSPVSSIINVPSSSHGSSLTSTSNSTTNSNTANTKKDVRHSRKIDSSPKNGSIRSLSPLSLFRRASTHIDASNKQMTNKLNPYMSQNSNNSAGIKTSHSDNKLIPPTQINSIFTDLFGISTPGNSTSQINNVNISTHTNNRRISNASTSNTTNQLCPNSSSKHSIDTLTLSSNNNNTNTEQTSDIISLGNASQSATVKEIQFTKSTEPHDSFTFEPGDYIYTFEQVISPTYPESIRADYGFVEYFLLATVERCGAFKTDLHARLPVTIVRTPSDNSVEESEPIVISKDWEGRLFYDILIASKDIILDAFLPIHFSFLPSDKVTLHRIRVYVTETMEYYCKNKKVHRMEPTKKFLLAELNGPKLSNAPDDSKPLKAKYMGNLLEEDGYLVNKDFELQVFIPSRFGNNQYLHPDTGFEYIKSNHWIKICLRLSQVIDNKRKHYEISIDSPIHVLNRLCSHANILLPSYDSHLLANTVNVTNTTKDESNFTEISYHNSNIFFPKEIVISPLVSPDVKPLDINLNCPPISPIPRSTKTITVNNNGIVISNSKSKFKYYQDDKDIISTDAEVFKSPKLRSNIYQPKSLQRELASPQAIPLSPITSSRRLSKASIVDDLISLHNASNETPPPSFDSICKNSGKEVDKMPSNPPSYEEALKLKTNSITDYHTIVSIKKQNNVRNIQRIPKIVLNRSQESLLDKSEIETNIDNELDSCSIHNDDTDISDIASGFSFQGSLHYNFPSISPKTKNLDTSRFHRRSSIKDNLPSTIRTDNTLFTDLNEVLGNMSEEEGQAQSPKSSTTPQIMNTDIQPPHSIINNVQDISTALEVDPNNTLKPSVSADSSQGNISARSSFETSGFSLRANASTMEPLLQPLKSNHTTNKSIDDSFRQSFDSVSDYIEEPIIDSSVDLTTLFDRNSIGWLPLQIANNNHPEISNYHLKLAKGIETRDSLYLTQTPVTSNETSSNCVNRTNENNEPKHIMEFNNDKENFPKTIDETLD